jgi:general secretion pathway protein E
MILVTGPTGSGKTTTLYSALNTINSPDKKIVTVEDPVEYQMDGVNQVQVQPNIGLTFAHTLRTFLRQDPDVMLIGEIRDLETAEIAIQAALTGHVVFSTLHTNDAAGAITRLEDMGVERFLIASSVVAVLAQRLVRRVCTQCKKTFHLDDEERLLLARELDLLPDEIASTYARGMGCKECAGSGYRGRLGIYEFLQVDEAIQREIVRGSDRNDIFKAAMQNGMISLRMDGMDKVKNGITTYEEVLRVTR